MKKVLLFCLVLFCTLSVFAADVSAKVRIVASYGENGFSLTSNEGIWNPVFAVSVSTGDAGASFSWRPVDFSYSDFEYKIWFKPEEGSPWKFTFGSNIATGFTEEIAFENLLVYGKVDYNDYNSKTASEDKYYANAAFGFGYKPYEYRDFSNASMFVSSSLNLINTKTGTFHIDNLTKLNIEENKPSLNYSLTETTYGLALEDWTPFYNKGAINKPFSFDESYYFTYWSQIDSKYENYGFVATTPSFGLRYKYYTESDMENENGLYGCAVAGSTIEGKVFEVSAEIGRDGSEFVGRIQENIDAFYYNVLIGLEADWSEGFSVRPELYSKISYNIEGGYNLYLVSNYNNAYNKIGSADGVYFTPGFTTNVGVCGIEANATVGFDSLKNFRWNTQSMFTVSF